MHIVYLFFLSIMVIFTSFLTKMYMGGLIGYPKEWISHVGFYIVYVANYSSNIGFGIFSFLFGGIDNEYVRATVNSFQALSAYGNNLDKGNYYGLDQYFKNIGLTMNTVKDMSYTPLLVLLSGAVYVFFSDANQDVVRRMGIAKDVAKARNEREERERVAHEQHMVAAMLKVRQQALATDATRSVKQSSAAASSFGASPI